MMASGNVLLIRDTAARRIMIGGPAGRECGGESSVRLLARAASEMAAGTQWWRVAMCCSFGTPLREESRSVGLRAGNAAANHPPAC